MRGTGDCACPPFVFCRLLCRKRSPQTTGEIFFGEFVAKIGDDLFGRLDFDKLAQMKSSAVCGTMRQPFP